MKILHVLDHSIPLHSGYTFRTCSILEQQRVLGWETVHLTSPKHQGAAGLQETVDGFSFYRTPPTSGWMARLPVLNQVAIINALTKRLQVVAEAERPDILHAHSPALNGVAAVRVGRRLGIPVVYEVRAFWEDAAVDHGTSREGGLRYRLTRALETYVLRHAAAVTTICEGLRADIAGRGIPADRITVIPNAVDPQSFQPGGQADMALADELGLTGRHVLGFIGSFYAYEGLELLLRALPLVRARDPQACVLLVGGGPQDESLRRQVKTLQLEDCVVFTGRVPHAEVQRYYDLVDVFVYPRLSMRLTELVTPLKPLEAMAQGRLVVASDVGGHRELIRDGENGQLFAAGDPAALAESVLQLLASESEWSTRRQQARDYVERERTWPVSVANYRAVYGRLVADAALQ